MDHECVRQTDRRPLVTASCNVVGRRTHAKRLNPRRPHSLIGASYLGPKITMVCLTNVHIIIIIIIIIYTITTTVIILV